MNLKALQNEEDDDPLMILKTILLQVEWVFVHICVHVNIIDTCVCVYGQRSMLDVFLDHFLR